MTLAAPSAAIQRFDITKAADSAFFQGHFKSQDIVRDPLVSGFAFIKWLKLPSWLTNSKTSAANLYANFADMTEKNLRVFQGISDIDLSTFSIQEGFGNSENMFAGGIGKFQGFSMTHREYSGSPIRNAYTFWVSAVRDPATNIARYPKDEQVEYSAANHTGELLYVTTRPDADNVQNSKVIEFACLYTMVMPTRIPLGHMNFQAGSNDGTEIEMPFIGVPHISPLVDDLAVQTLQQMYPAVSGMQVMGEYQPSSAG